MSLFEGAKILSRKKCCRVSPHFTTEGGQMNLPKVL